MEVYFKSVVPQANIIDTVITITLTQIISCTCCNALLWNYHYILHSISRDEDSRKLTIKQSPSAMDWELVLLIIIPITCVMFDSCIRWIGNKTFPELYPGFIGVEIFLSSMSWSHMACSVKFLTSGESLFLSDTFCVILQVSYH